MATREQFVDAMRAYLGAPFRHQGRSREGVDCVGLAICALAELSITVFDHVHTGYRRIPQEGILKGTLDAEFICVPVAEARMGDCLLMRMKRQICHVAFVSQDKPRHIIHSVVQRGVIEHVLDGPYRDAVIAVYRHPEVT